MKKQKKIGLVFSHCHWDIEWYMPFRSFRFWLTELLDRLIEICKTDQKFKTYVLDGQVAPVEHYLAVKPENELKIKKLIKSGRLSIGPFYTQFDEWLISGESIIRNCLYGIRQAKRFNGNAMKAGYLPDNFGHPKQMPQILSGFGIDSLIFQRGMPDKPGNLPDEFCWEGLDGTKTLAVHLADYYGNAFAPGAREKEWGLKLLRFSPYRDTFFGYEFLTDKVTNCDVKKGAEELIATAQKTLPRHPSGVIPLGNGCDHSPPQAQIGEIIAYANKIQGEILFIHGNCQDLVEKIKERAKKLHVFSDDLWGAGYQYILTGTLTTRSYIKQQNFAAENLLEKYAEPLAGTASLFGRSYPKTLLEEAWRFMFLNHAHDSIHGSSVDPVHLEMMQRFAAVRQIATGVCHDSLKYLGNILSCQPKDKGFSILTYNPVAATDKINNIIDLWVAAKYDNFRVEDSQGNHVPAQVVDDEFSDAACLDDQARRVLISAPVPSFGFASFAFLPGKKEQGSFALGNKTARIENEFLRVQFKKGVLDIYDKVARHGYSGLNIIEDEADAGDAFDFSPPWQKNPVLRSDRFPSKCRLIENGPVRATLLIETPMRIPLCLEGEKRSRDTVPLLINTRVSLYRKTRYVAVSVSFDNQARDHRLRLKCPTGITSKTVKSQGHFGIIERPIRNPYSGKNWLQPPPQTFHFREWTAVDDDKHGLAVACQGLYEYESTIDKSGVNLYVTLLRGIGVMGKGNMRTRKGLASDRHLIPDAQCLGPQRFDYVFVPYICSKNSQAPFLASVSSFLYPTISHQIGTGESDSVAKREPADFPPLFFLQPDNLVISCFKRAADDSGYILRFWENEGKETEAKLSLSTRFRRVFQTNLNEEVIKEIKSTRVTQAEACDHPEQESLTLKVKPYKIITLKLVGGAA